MLNCCEHRARIVPHSVRRQFIEMANELLFQRWFSFILICLSVFPCSSKCESERSEVDFTILNVNEKQTLNESPRMTVSDQVKRLNVGIDSSMLNNYSYVCRRILDGIKMVEQNESVIIFDTSKADELKKTIRNVAAHLELPTVSYSHCLDAHECDNLNESDDANNYYVPIVSPSHVILNVVRSMVRAFEMENISVFYAPSISESENFSSNFRRILENTTARLYYIPFHDISANTTATYMENARMSNSFNYFLMGQKEWILKFLQSTKNATYFRKNFLWILLLTDVQVIEKEKFIRDLNSTFSKLSSRKNLTMYLAFPNDNYDDAQFFYSLLRSASKLSSTFLTTNISEDACDSAIWPGSEDNRPSFQSQFSEHLSNKYKNTMVEYKIVEIVDFDEKHVSIWRSSNTEENITRMSIKKPVKLYRVSVALVKIKTPPVPVFDFELTDFIFSCIRKQTPFVMYSDVSGNYSGYSIDLFDKLAERLNFEYEILFRHDHFGHMAPDSSWDKVMGDLVDRRADIGLGSMSVTAEREAAIDFTVPYYDRVGIAILVKKIELERTVFRFLTVLETGVWLCIIAALLCTSFLMWMFDKLSPFSYQNDHRQCSNDPGTRIFDLKECLWFCMTSLTPQGGGEAPKCLSSKIVAATWWLFGFIIVASYTANLAAFFTKARLVSTIESLDELSNQYRISYAPVNNSDEMFFFKHMRDIEQMFYDHWTNISLNDSLTQYERSKYAVWEYPVATKYTKLWEAMEKTKFPRNVREAVERVANSTAKGGFAFLGDATDLKYLARNSCQFQVIGEEFSRKPYAIGIQQNSPLKNDFDEVLLKLLTTRWLQKLKSSWWPESTCEAHFDGIHLNHILGIFIFIALGITIAVISLGLEYLWFKYRWDERFRMPYNGSGQLETQAAPKILMKNASKNVAPSEQQSSISGGCRRRNSKVAFE